MLVNAQVDNLAFNDDDNNNDEKKRNYSGNCENILMAR
jgi:hypothetical protein